MFSKIKKFIYPFLFSICAFAVLLLLFLRSENNSVSLANGINFVVAVFIIVGVFVPVYCFLYCKKILLKQKTKFIFTVYNSIVITLFYLLPLCTEKETYLYSLILFCWCEFWSALPMIKAKNKTR